MVDQQMPVIQPESFYIKGCPVVQWAVPMCYCRLQLLIGLEATKPRTGLASITVRLRYSLDSTICYLWHDDWLDPGPSKTFQLSINAIDNTCSHSVVSMLHLVYAEFSFISVKEIISIVNPISSG